MINKKIIFMLVFSVLLFNLVNAEIYQDTSFYSNPTTKTATWVTHVQEDNGGRAYKNFVEQYFGQSAIVPNPQGYTLLDKFAVNSFSANTYQALANIQALPYYLGDGVIDYCNVSYVAYFYELSTNNTKVSTTTQTNSVYHNGGVATVDYIDYSLARQDEIYIRVICHFNTTGAYNLASTLTTPITNFAPSYSCQDQTVSFEELTNVTENSANDLRNQLRLYSSVNDIVTTNYEILVIINWILKFGFLGTALFLVIAVPYYILLLVRSTNKKFKRRNY